MLRAIRRKGTNGGAPGDLNLPYATTLITNKAITVTKESEANDSKELFAQFDYVAQDMSAESDDETISGPNVQAIAKASEKFRYSEFVITLYSTIGLAAGIIGSEIEYIEVAGRDIDLPHAKWWAELLYYICSATTALLIISLFQRYTAHYHMMEVKSERNAVVSMLSFSYIGNFLIEAVLCLPHPCVWLYGMLTTIDDGSGTITTYDWNNLLITGALNFRLYLYCRIFIIYSQYRSGRAHRITNMYGLDADYTFTFRCLMKKQPMAVLGGSFMVSGLLGGYCFRLLERPHQDSFNSIWNSTWCSVITMTTVGYGDVTPKSFFGRIMGIVLSLWGVAVVSLMVIFISAGLEFNAGQKKSYQTMEKLELKGKLRKAAAVVIEHAFIRQRVRKIFTPHSDFYREADLKYKRKLNIFKNMVKRIRTTFQSKNIEMHYVETEITHLVRRVDQVEEKFDRFEHRQGLMDDKLDQIMKMMMRMSSNMGHSHLVPDMRHHDSSATSIPNAFDER